MRIEGSPNSLNFDCVEAAFQLIKIILSYDLHALQGGANVDKPAKIKSAGQKVTINQSWFESINEEEPVSQSTMIYLQAWAATCPAHHALLYKLIDDAVTFGVHPNNVHIHEHNPDYIYGTGSHTQDFKILFNTPFSPKGKDILGKAISSIARKVFELKTLGAYIHWFEDTHPPLFKLNPNARV